MLKPLLRPLSAVAARLVYWITEHEARFLLVTFVPPVAFGSTSAVSGLCGWTTLANLTAPMVMLWILAIGWGVLIVQPTHPQPARP